MLVRMTILALSALAIYGWPYSIEVLTVILALFATVYYYLVFKVFTGLSKVNAIFDDKKELHDRTMGTSTNIFMGVVVFVASPYSHVVAYAAPWLILNFVSLIISWLIFANFIEITDKDDE